MVRGINSPLIIIGVIQMITKGRLIENDWKVIKENVEEESVITRLEKNNSVIIIEETYYPPDVVETEIIVIEGDIPFKKTHEEQLDKLLDLNLTIHPCKEDDCWDVYSSTRGKAFNRMCLIKQSFPHSTGRYLEEEGILKVNLYGEIII